MLYVHMCNGVLDLLFYFADTIWVWSVFKTTQPSQTYLPQEGTVILIIIKECLKRN